MRSEDTGLHHTNTYSQPSTKTELHTNKGKKKEGPTFIRGLIRLLIEDPLESEATEGVGAVLFIGLTLQVLTPVEALHD